MTYPNGSTHIGLWDDDKKTGIGKYIDAKGAA